MAIPEYGWLSLAPPALTIALALGTRRVLPALFAGVLASHTVLSAPNFATVPFVAIEQMLDTAANRDNLLLIVFSLMVGGLLQLIKQGRGFEAFASHVVRRGNGGRRTVFGLNWVIGCGMFLEGWSNVLINGAATSALYDRLGLSRLRLAYFTHTIGICIVSMAVMNGWGAFYVGLLNVQGVERPLAFIVESLPFMIYQGVSLLLVAVVMASGLAFGPLRRFEAEARARGLAAPESRATEPNVGGVTPRVVFMLLPLGVLLVTVFGALYFTGGRNLLAGDAGLSITYAVAAASAVAAGLLLAFKVMRAAEVEKHFIAGMAKFLDVGILIVLALSLGELTRALGTGPFVAQLLTGALPLFIVPALIFVAGAVMSFATGTSYGTFSIMIPIALPLAAATGLDAHLLFGACIAGGLFGDNTSPISDSTIVSAMGAEVRIVDHVATQLPFALVAGALTIIVFLVLGATVR